MRYNVKFGDRTIDVDLAGDAVTVAGRRVNAELHAIDGRAVRHLLIDGCSHTIIARPGDPGIWEIHIAGRRFDVEVLDERTRAIRAMTGNTQVARGPKPVRAPMPGMIVRLEVKPGETVKHGQGVAVIEAMKMENELKADGEGVVARVLVEAGQAVQKGAVLIEFQSS
ncbi:MAG: acetyl-CoA carboxylase biotin carboxyl carrier protein subunit [Longimicrobiales bacterium]